MSSKVYTKFTDIPKFTPWSSYLVDVGWDYLEHQLAHYADDMGLDLDPDFQRGHVWTEAQQIAYVEHCLRGGKSTNMLHWNCHDWRENTGMHPVVLVDGKQRLTAARAFISGELRAFGSTISEYTDRLRIADCRFKFHINDLKTRAEVLQWYLELNAGGVVHTDEELDKVRELLKKEKV